MIVMTPVQLTPRPITPEVFDAMRSNHAARMREQMSVRAAKAAMLSLDERARFPHRILVPLPGTRTTLNGRPATAPAGRLLSPRLATREQVNARWSRPTSALTCRGGKPSRPISGVSCRGEKPSAATWWTRAVVDHPNVETHAVIDAVQSSGHSSPSRLGAPSPDEDQPRLGSAITDELDVKVSGISVTTEEPVICASPSGRVSLATTTSETSPRRPSQPSPRPGQRRPSKCMRDLFSQSTQTFEAEGAKDVFAPISKPTCAILHPISELTDISQPRVDTEGLQYTLCLPEDETDKCTIKLFRVKIPKNRQQNLDTSGLNLRTNFSMNAVGVENAEGGFSIDIMHRPLREGDFLWFGFDGIHKFHPTGESSADWVCFVPDRCIIGLSSFLGIEWTPGQPLALDLFCRDFPVMMCPVPSWFHRKTIKESGSRTKFGINILAVGATPETATCFPSKGTLLLTGSWLFVPISDRDRIDTWLDETYVPELGQRSSSHLCSTALPEGGATPRNARGSVVRPDSAPHAKLRGSFVMPSPRRASGVGPTKRSSQIEATLELHSCQ